MSAASREEIKEEVWAQLKAALNATGDVQLDDANLVDWFLDPDIELPNPGTVTNVEPLLINHVGSLAARPEAFTEIGNLFLAADYVRTHTDLATMEGANEAHGERRTRSLPSPASQPALQSVEVRHPGRECATRNCWTRCASAWDCPICSLRWGDSASLSARSDTGTFGRGKCAEL
jgi:hypothetical protein